MIQIIEENDFFILLIKPEGYSVHNQSPSVAEHLKKSGFAPHFVNRLDQDTSGLVLVARTPELHAPLSLALENGEKFYRALLRGAWKNPDLQVMWSWPISDKAEGRDNPQGKSQDRVRAETKVRVVRSNPYFTEVEAELITGRQHQIRKHAALSKHPIVGDQRYNEKKYNAKINQMYQSERMHLHAEKLVFNFNNKNYAFEHKYNLDQFFSA